MVNFLKIYSNPDKYAIELPIDKIVADTKVDNGRVNHFVNIIKQDNSVKAVVVVKHPREDYYAVLDGHHRFWAQKKIGMSTIKSAVVKDLFGLGFHMTKNGLLQPDPKFTKYIRVPLKKFCSYITGFVEDPERSLKNTHMKLFKK